jgi:hypothetical protein
MAPKPPLPSVQRPVAAHVQAAQNAVRGAVQPRLHPVGNPAPAGRPLSPPPQPGRQPTVQPRLPLPVAAPRQPAAHVQAAVHASAARGTVLARAQNPTPARAPHVEAATRPPVREARPPARGILQPVMASRVQRADSPKVVVGDGKVTRYDPDPDIDAGINISFQSDEHAQGFLDNKGEKRDDYEIVNWDFDDELYNMIQYRINGKGWNKKWANKAKWADVEKCPRPVPTSDHWVQDKDNAPHLKSNKWIAVLNDYAKGGDATVYRPGEDLSLLKGTDQVVVLEAEGNMLMSLTAAQEIGYEEYTEYITEWAAKFRGLVYE